jgi:hypothetical protein
MTLLEHVRTIVLMVFLWCDQGTVGPSVFFFAVSKLHERSQATKDPLCFPPKDPFLNKKPSLFSFVLQVVWSSRPNMRHECSSFILVGARVEVGSLAWRLCLYACRVQWTSSSVFFFFWSEQVTRAEAGWLE